MLGNDSLEVRIVLDPNLPLLRRMTRRIVMLENANAVKDSIIDQLSNINADQTDEINQLKAQRDALNEEIEGASVALATFDPDPSNPPSPQGEGS